ncbi:uncharacterized mitochondrial protein AtMg00310-like [Magnolia sinica]|uniref:uncharacterized mitochondrial protein AtMg00310-like n=1 Tax=Magnolia sinica TaxID=86752 RepID=UPI002657AD52|nr:uncharacterized mitochondrial protein AtMg00310-like [Magnolia sinica]
MEVLSRGLKKLTASNACQPYRTRSRSLPPSHLLFADDTTIFTNDSRSSIRNLVAFLQKFKNISSLKINNSKSSFLASSKMLLLRTHNIERISSWKARFLNQAARTTLIKHVLSSIPVHILAAVDVPIKMLQTLESKLADFFWGWSEGSKKFHWVSWRRITYPTKEGGLGIKPLREISAALRLKRAWTIFFAHKNTLWAKFMRSKYMINDSRESASQRNIDSPAWKGIRKLLHLVEDNSHLLLGDDNSNVWNDNL